MAILAAVQECQFKVLEVLFNWGANPVHLSINQGDTPIHAALSIALGGDKGDYINSNVFFSKLYDNLSMKNYYSYIICQKPDEDQVSFSDHNLFVVHRRCCRKLFTFSSSSPEPLGQFQPNMAQSILGLRGFKFVQMKGHSLLQVNKILK